MSWPNSGTSFISAFNFTAFSVEYEKRIIKKTNWSIVYSLSFVQVKKFVNKFTPIFYNFNTHFTIITSTVMLRNTYIYIYTKSRNLFRQSLKTMDMP